MTRDPPEGAKPEGAKPEARGPFEYAPQELAEMLDGMQIASNEFYRLAQRAGFHEFLEFTGFMNEYIKSCQRMLANGINFVTDAPQLEIYEASYIGEKFGCIFQDSFFGRDILIRAFCRSAFGVHITGIVPLQPKV